MQWTNPQRAGLLPLFLNDRDPRPAREQLHESYAHGGGFQPFEGFDLKRLGVGFALKYPNDPLMKEVARAQLRQELVVLFEYDWVGIIQPDETFVVARMD